MNTHLLALQLMAAQGILGAFDTLYHHELTEGLAKRKSARLELSIHAIRALIYSLLFIGLSCWEWHGLWALVLLVVFSVEVLLTLWDFVVEDKTRLLPATERITHTVLAINGGAFITLLILNFPVWCNQPTAFSENYNGYLSIFLALCGFGVGLSGVRDAVAAYQLGKLEEKELSVTPIHFSNKVNRVLVTGGTGFIGQLLVRELLKNGQDVVVLTRQPRIASWIFGGEVKCIQTMEELPKTYPIDIIINLAGARILGWRWTEARKKALLKSRVNLTKNLISWIAGAERKPKLLLSASAIGFYGIQAQQDMTAFNEQSPPQSIFMSQLCQEWETAARKAIEHGVTVVTMRFGLVLGHQGALPMLLLPIKLGMGGALGSGKQIISWIHVRDLLRGIAHLWKLNDINNHPMHLIYNFTAPETLTQKEFSQVAAQVLHRPCVIPTPGWPMRLALGEQSDLLLEGQRVAPINLLASQFAFEFSDLKSALTDLC